MMNIHIVYPEGFQRVFNRPGPFWYAQTDTLKELFDEWNGGSGRESEEFVDAGVRSMSIGDFVGIDGNYYQCKPSGWELVKLKYVNNILNMVRKNVRDDPGYRMAREHMGRIEWDAARAYRDCV